jgi:hypothetical protein
VEGAQPQTPMAPGDAPDSFANEIAQMLPLDNGNDSHEPPSDDSRDDVLPF